MLTFCRLKHDTMSGFIDIQVHGQQSSAGVVSGERFYLFLVLFFPLREGSVVFGEGFFLPSRAEVVLQSGPAARLFSKEKVFCGGCFYFFLQVGSVAFGEGFFSPSAGGGFASRRVTFFVWTKKVTKKSHSPRALRGSSSVAS